MRATRCRPLPSIGRVTVPAEPADLASQITLHGDSAQLVTVNPAGRPHVVAVLVAQAGDELNVPAGTKTRANVLANPSVTLLFGPPQGGEYTLVVDGDAVVSPGETLTIRPSSALLHRVAHATGDGPRCFAVEVPATG